MIFPLMFFFFVVFAVALIVIAIQQATAAYVKRHPRDPPDV